MEKIGKWGTLMLGALVALFAALAFGSAMVWQVKWHGVQSILLAGGFCAGIAVFSRGLSCSPCGACRQKDVLLLAILMGLCLLVNGVAIWFLDRFHAVGMVSDFELAQNCLESGKLCVQHPHKFQYWCNYETLLSSFGVLLSPSLFVGQMVNAVCMTLSIYPVYRMSEQIGGRRVAIFVCLLMIGYPALIAYGAVLTSEYLTAMFLLYGIYFIETACRDRDRLQPYWRLSLGGVSLALAQLFKPVVPVYLLALLLAGALMTLVMSSRRMLSFEIRRFLVVSAVFFAVSKALVWAMPSVTVDGDETQPWTGFPWNRLAVGLHLKSDGAWSSESDAFYSMEPMEAKHYVVSRFSQDYKSYPTLLFKKLIRLYNTENGIKYWMSQVSDLSTTGRFALMMDGWFVLLQVVFAFGLVEVLRLLIRGQTSHQLLLSLWMLIGFSCVVTLFEFQNRYRTAWYPIYFLIMPYGVILLGRIATAVKRRLRGAV